MHTSFWKKQLCLDYCHYWLTPLSLVNAKVIIWNLRLWNIGKTYNLLSHPATRRPGDVVTTSLCTSQWFRRYFSNKTPNDVSLERRQYVSLVHLHVLLECRDECQRGVMIPSVRLQNVSNKPRMKHPTASQCYVTKMSQRYVSTTSH